ncbi:MAG: hypothetical protein ACXVH3_21095 [Solirubrobacteraceae bacterium]
MTNLTGTLSGQNFDLGYPGQNGTVITILMTPGGTPQFNADLSTLQGDAG